MNESCWVAYKHVMKSRSDFAVSKIVVKPNPRLARRLFGGTRSEAVLSGPTPQRLRRAIGKQWTTLVHANQ